MPPKNEGFPYNPAEEPREVIDVDSLTPAQKAKIARYQAENPQLHLSVGEVARIILAQEEVEKHNPEGE